MTRWYLDGECVMDDTAYDDIDWSAEIPTDIPVRAAMVRTVRVTIPENENTTRDVKAMRHIAIRATRD